MPSINTTDLGPRLSASTKPGQGADRAIVDLREASLGIRVSESALTSGVDGAYVEGEIVVMNQTASAASIGIRSGNTIYVFDSRVTAITI